nr:uncharacterized protein LOC111507095 [Leptinotarsa decemlineata]
MDVPILKEHPEIDSGEGRNSHSGPEVETDLHQGEKMSSENSDYDSADSYSDDPNVKIRSRASDEHSNSDAGSVTLEREEGDGQESVPSKKVDDDEDKKNPQYIPKRGTFYEHDDRTAEDDESNVIVEEDKDKDGKKKVWQDKKERWAHDRFSEQEQGPKTRTELIGIYGYDIRNEDGPPRARRRRRYGRGPNKYTRNWEDEDAYNKPQPIVHRPKKTRPGKESEEFPPLVRESTSEPSAETESNENREQAEQVRKTEERTEPPKEQPVPQTQIPNERVQPVTNNAQEQQSNKNSQQRIGSGRVIKPTAINGFTSRTADIRKYNVKQEQVKILPNQNQAKGDFIQSQNFTNKKNLQDLEREMNKLSVDGVYKGSGNTKKICAVLGICFLHSVATKMIMEVTTNCIKCSTETATNGYPCNLCTKIICRNCSTLSSTDLQVILLAETVVLFFCPDCTKSIVKNPQLEETIDRFRVGVENYKRDIIYKNMCLQLFLEMNFCKPRKSGMNEPAYNGIWLNSIVDPSTYSGEKKVVSLNPAAKPFCHEMEHSSIVNVQNEYEVPSSPSSLSIGLTSSEAGLNQTPPSSALESRNESHRSHNLMVFNLPESSATSLMERIEFDMREIEEIIEFLGVSAYVCKVYRIGRFTGIRTRPVVAVLSSEREVIEAVKNRKKLRNTHHYMVRLGSDKSRKQRDNLNDYSQQSPPVAAVTQPLIQQPAQIIPATTTQVPQMATLQPIPQQVPVPNAFPHAYPPPPPTFLQSGYAAPTYLTPQVPQGLSYVQGQAAYTPNYQSYPPQQFNPATPPTELYQPQGGITYYSTDQQLAQRQAPQKRPKAAIPIVAPPGQEKKTDDTNYQQNETVEARETNEPVEAQQ